MNASLFSSAVDGFGTRVAVIGDQQWSASTPCAEWDVRALVNHVVGELLWLPPLLEGKTIAEVGSQFDGDVLGDDPGATWKMAAAAAQSAAAKPGAQERTVHLSFGDFPGSEYLGQVTTDLTIHSWDLARAVGADDRCDPALIEFVTEFLAPQIEMWRNPGIFATPVNAGADANRQDQLIASTGRAPDWTPGGA